MFDAKLFEQVFINPYTNKNIVKVFSAINISVKNGETTMMVEITAGLCHIYLRYQKN